MNTITAEARTAFQANQRRINDRFVQKMLEETPLAEQLGDSAEKVLRAGAEFLTSSLEAVIIVNQPVLLSHQLTWAKDRLPQDGINLPQLQTNLGIYKIVLAEILPPAHAQEVVSLIDPMIEALKNQP